jgi:hypothetical protein
LDFATNFRPSTPVYARLQLFWREVTPKKPVGFRDKLPPVYARLQLFLRR